MITYGQNLPVMGGLFLPPSLVTVDGSTPGAAPVVVANTLPAVVAIDTGNTPTGNISVSNTTPTVATATTATAATTTVAGSLLNYLLTVVTDPFNHIIAVVVLLLIGRYVWKHFLKGLV